MTGRQVWQWLGVAFMDDEGNVRSLQIDRPDASIEHQRELNRFGEIVYEGLQIRAAGRVREWAGNVPQNYPREIEGVVTYPPLPVESEE